MADQIPANDHEGTVVPLDNALKRRFYPVLLLLECLTDMYPYRRIGLDPPPDFISDPEQLFHNFLSKIAYLACTEPCGSAVAAATVLVIPEGFQYVFGFNDRNESKRRSIQIAIENILSTFRHPLPANPADRQSLQKRALEASLTLCRVRVKSYVTNMLNHLSSCIRACRNDSSTSGEIILASLTELKESFDYAGGPIDPSKVATLISKINGTYKSDIFPLIGIKLAREQQDGSSSHWTDFVHTSGRLLSYKQAIDVTHRASDIWPQLFDSFQVTTIQSSTKMTQCLKGIPSVSTTIVGRMTSDKSLQAEYNEYLQASVYDRLDKRIHEEWCKKSESQPTVHAEMLLHNWLERTPGGVRPERFFMRWKFIGSSKPPCKLCAYYFDEHPTDVQVRPSHRNIYFSWRMPDIYEEDGVGAVTLRRKTMEKIKDRICADIGRILKEKFADGRPHDSSAYTTFAAQQGPGISLDSGMISDIHALSIESPHPDNASGSHTFHETKAEDNAPDSDGEEILLFSGRRGRASS